MQEDWKSETNIHGQPGPRNRVSSRLSCSIIALFYGIPVHPRTCWEIHASVPMIGNVPAERQGTVSTTWKKKAVSVDNNISSEEVNSYLASLVAFEGVNSYLVTLVNMEVVAHSF